MLSKVSFGMLVMCESILWFIDKLPVGLYVLNLVLLIPIYNEATYDFYQIYQNEYFDKFDLLISFKYNIWRIAV